MRSKQRKTSFLFYILFVTQCYLLIIESFSFERLNLLALRLHVMYSSGADRHKPMREVLRFTLIISAVQRSGNSGTDRIRKETVQPDAFRVDDRERPPE